jgi:hypothetical protein
MIVKGMGNGGFRIIALTIIPLTALRLAVALFPRNNLAISGKRWKFKSMN